MLEKKIVLENMQWEQNTLSERYNSLNSERNKSIED